MSTEALPLTGPASKNTERNKSHDVVFFIALTAIIISAFAIRAHVGSKSFLDYDEWQHVFMASVPRVTDLRFELRTNAHPPLFFWMLRGLLNVGHGPLLYRAISIFAGTGAVFLVGLICRRACRSEAIALLAAAALGLATSAITVSTEVRSYQLSIFFMLAAFYWYLEILSNSEARLKWHWYLGFALATSLAVASHYYAALFLGACYIVPFLLALLIREQRGTFFLPGTPRSLSALLYALLVPSVVLLKLSLAHARNQPIQGYLFDFYWGFKLHETKWEFLSRNLQNLWNLFAPVGIQNRWTFLLVLAILSLLAVYLFFKIVRTDSAETSRVLPPLFAFILVAELAVLSFADKYPFGGLLRHQYVAAPFLLIAVFVLADAALERIRPRLQHGIFLALGGWILLRFVFAPSLVTLPGFILTKQLFDEYRSVFPQSQGIFLDHWSVIAYFMNTDSEPRRFVRRIAAPGLVDQYEVGSSSGPRTEIFYNKLDFNLDLTNSDVYRRFAACLHDSGLRELSLFFFIPGDNVLPQPPAAMRQTMEQLAARQGLKITKIVITPKTVSAGFALR